MKKILVALILLGLIVWGVFTFTKEETKEEKTLTKVKVGEVTHSVFYAPQYVAHALGYYKDENLDVDIVLTSGANKKK